MSSSASGSGSGRRAKANSISGWSDFDLKQRRKQQGLDNLDYEPYPSLSGSQAQPQSLINKNGSKLDKPFSSLVAPIPSMEDKNLPRQLPARAQTDDTVKAYGKLKDLQPWADESLIQDVLAGVDNNVDEALSLLEAMSISAVEVDKKDKVDSTYHDLDAPDNSFEVKEDTISFINGNHKPSEDEESSLTLLEAIKSLPMESEPEWGEDDAYLIYRKDAIKMTRGNHAASRHFSLKAQQECAAAERLNAKAANEILNLRNCRNDIWTLDLHGLHAAEAVEALSERLKSVESLVSKNRLAESAAPSVQSISQHPTSRPRTTALLQVITGKGNHSRGSAALPSAIRSFLSEKRYHFDETRPGVIAVRPKFRLQ